ncbi:Binding-protein-dependent transport system inner membrane component [Acididesulfobacillus acetoxydans]|uniref:ABC-type Fe3+ transport system, permease component n=1 Tax=Acididesulfobacillus acetoxydans TaxID=1561005 RepID=A0A8S0VX94_9FIRM|nr:iron ABC transporter permease [Acididesulfobacillus acetoxydans]CAA7601723.1 Binding-protein-dependent transport system inner membrane component [Acididesulfobacillus acetoxydans]CEJ09058.1 ABC-type Fe3+ transport system, permease component [Acididesulfobacillus acetoxydans]
MITSSNKAEHTKAEHIGSRLRHWGSGAGDVPGAILLVVLIAYPLATLLGQALLPHLFSKPMSLLPSLAPLRSVFGSKLNLEALVNSLSIGLAEAVLAIALGSFSALALARVPRKVGVVLDAFIWVVFFVPSYVIAQGWVILMQDKGILAQLTGLPNGWSAWFFTRFGLVLIMGLRYFPYVHFGMQEALLHINQDLVQAGRAAGAGRRQIMTKIILPLLTPAWLAGGSIAFAEGFGDFGIAAAITPQAHIPMATYQIYASLSEAPVNYPAAAGMSMVVVLVTAAAIVLQFWWLKKRNYNTLSSAASRDPAGGSNRRSMAVGVAALLFVALFLPLGATLCASLWKTWSGGMSAGNWTLSHYFRALRLGGDGWQALGRSLEYSLVTAFLTMSMALVVGFQMSFKDSRLSRLLNILTMSVIAVPGIVLAASFIFAWNAVWLIPIHLVLYGTPVCLAMAYIASSLPYAIRLEVGAMSQLPANILKAAESFGARNRTVIRKIVLPLVRGTAISTFFMTFTGVMFELPASSLLYPPGQPTFSVLIQSKFDNFDWSGGAALTVIGLVVVFAAYGLGRCLVYYSARVRAEKAQQADRDMVPAAGG